MRTGWPRRPRATSPTDCFERTGWMTFVQRLVGCACLGLAAPPQAQPDAPSRVGPPAAAGSARPLWELGLATFGTHGPNYPASRSDRWRGALVPIAVYRGMFFRVDDGGVRGRLVNTPRFELDVSGAAAFNPRADQARAGMPGLDYIFEGGPQAIYRVPLAGGHQFSGHLKWRAVMSTDWKRIDSRGWVIEPEARWQIRRWPDAASTVQFSISATWASEKLQDYFYQVDPVYATPDRPAFDARAGYFGSTLRASWGRRLGATTVLNVGTSLAGHDGAANRHSPLFP